MRSHRVAATSNHSLQRVKPAAFWGYRALCSARYALCPDYALAAPVVSAQQSRSMSSHGRRRPFVGSCLRFSLLTASWTSIVHASATPPTAASPAYDAQADASKADELAAQSTAVSWTGVFVGSLESAGVRVPATTELREQDGVISGRYSFADRSGSTEGTLSQCVRLQVRAIRCAWQDRYGTGERKLNLSKDGSMIAGRWRAADDSTWYDWNGSR